VDASLYGELVHDFAEARRQKLYHHIHLRGHEVQHGVVVLIGQLHATRFAPTELPCACFRAFQDAVRSD